MTEAQHLRQAAELCRHEATNSTTKQTRQALREMASDFDRRAKKVEQVVSGR
jgi:hypothetical protein